jgi:transcriptional regulator with XRE-family HTH domain
MPLLRRLMGEVLRRHRLRQSRTLRDVSTSAGVSLGYLSEVERGRKEASSELLSAICGALDVSLSELLREVSDELAREERRLRLAPVGFAPPHILPATTRPVAGVAPLVPVRTAPVPAERPAVRVPVAQSSSPVTHIVAA